MLTVNKKALVVIDIHNDIGPERNLYEYDFGNGKTVPAGNGQE